MSRFYSTFTKRKLKAFLYSLEILHINFGHSRWTDTIRCSNIGDLRSRIPTPGFICLYIIMSLQAKMAAEIIGVASQVSMVCRREKLIQLLER
ncbi:unnamed protein product [Pocillopora meandrina]|uniref:Uncharacterized protein n=1 Tax=Pocillopora meandrina TaxID=46732 RepID=A0AAU9W931_9CNID|nr:unnamed protein product [Pocillopora meandrina]